MYCDVKWISAFFFLFVQPLPGGVMHSYVLSGFAREASAHRATVVDSIPFTHPAHVPALLELLRHQCAINTLLRSCVTSQGVGTGGRFIYFFTSWHLWKMDDLGQEKWKRVSNQMLFFFWWFSLWPAPWSPARVWDQLLCDLPPTWQRLPRCLWALAAKYLTKLKYDCNTEPESFSVSVQECYIDYLTYHTHPLFSVSTAMAFLSRFVWLIGAFFLSQCWWTYLILIRLAALCLGEEYRIPLWMNTFPLSWWGTDHGFVSTTSFRSYDMQKCNINRP